MNSLYGRINVLLVNFILTAGLMAILTACTDFFEKPPLANPSVSDVVLKRLKVHPRDHDQASLEWRMDYDLSQYWNWNTKIIFAYVQAEYETKLNGVNQASLFDVIITKKPRTKFKGRAKQEYEFLDQGVLRTYEEHLGTFQLPDEYTSESQALRAV